MRAEIMPREYEIGPFITQRTEKDQSSGAVATIRFRHKKLNEAICLSRHVVLKSQYTTKGAATCKTGLVVKIEEVTPDTKPSDEIIHVWWDGSGAPVQMSVGQLVNPESGPPPNDEKPLEKQEIAMAAGATIAIAGDTGKVLTAEPSDLI
jgi:hypothetical protein